MHRETHLLVEGYQWSEQAGIFESQLKYGRVSALKRAADRIKTASRLAHVISYDASARILASA
jgi:hypothetical protein